MLSQGDSSQNLATGNVETHPSLINTMYNAHRLMGSSAYSIHFACARFHTGILSLDNLSFIFIHLRLHSFVNDALTLKLFRGMVSCLRLC